MEQSSRSQFFKTSLLVVSGCINSVSKVTVTIFLGKLPESLRSLQVGSVLQGLNNLRSSYVQLLGIDLDV